MQDSRNLDTAFQGTPVLISAYWSYHLVHYSGQRVKLACVNWYGFHLEDLVINGLDRDAFHKDIIIILLSFFADENSYLNLFDS